MLLSIVMMVKNEEKFLYKTLDALKPLMNKIDSELIVLDTGSNDNTVEIAKQFTEKVYFKEWNNDFADMRNTSISYAKGKWLLVIDADEVLIKFEKLIGFFKSGDYKNYNTASIKLKNYTSNDLKEYNYMCINRFFRNIEFKYEGSIHEQPIYQTPIYNEIAEFDHYGYIFEDEEFKIKKMERNEILLFDELKKNPNDPYINYQLGKNFMVLNKNEEALVYMEKSKKLYEKMNVLATYVYSNLCRIYLKLGKNRDVESVCLNYIKKQNKNIDIYFYLSQAQINLGKIEKSIKSLEKYLYLVRNYNITEQSNSIFAYDDTSRLTDDAVIALMKLYYSMDRFEKVLELYETIEDNEKRKKSYYHLFMSIKHLKQYDMLLKYYDEIKEFKDDRDSYYYALEVLEKSLLEEEKNEVYKVILDIEGNYGKLNKFRYEKNIDLIEAKNILKEEKDTIYGSIINLAIKQNIDLIELLKDLDSVWIEKFVSYAIGHDRKVTVDLYKYIMQLHISFDLENLRI
ncbi:MAG: glycosyltransferase, partial [Paraclostridium sp.]